MKTIFNKTIKGLFYLEHQGHHHGNILTLLCTLLFFGLSFSDAYNQRVWLLWLTFVPIPIGHLCGAYRRSIEEEQIKKYLEESKKRSEEYFKVVHNYQKNLVPREGLNQ